MKYIVIEQFNVRYPIIFPEHLSHHEVMPEVKKVSAGFFYLSDIDGEVNVYGKSDSLQLGPLEFDKQRIEVLLSNTNSMWALIHEQE